MANQPPGTISSLQSTSSLRSTASDLVGSGATAVRDAASGPMGGLTESAEGQLAEAEAAGLGALTELEEGAADTVAGGASSLGGIGDTAQSAAKDSASQLIDLVEAIEERVLAEIERRGGRYAEMF